MQQATFSTKLAQPVLGRNGKWCAAFENFITRGDETFMSSSCTSAPLWFDAAAAKLAAERAVVVLEQTGKLPNMCELW